MRCRMEGFSTCGKVSRLGGELIRATFRGVYGNPDLTAGLFVAAVMAGGACAWGLWRFKALEASGGRRPRLPRA